MAAKDGHAARCLSHRWYGQQLCWSQHGPRVVLERSLHRLSMRYDADRRRGSRFPEANPPDRSSCPPTGRYGVRLPLQPLQMLRRMRRSESQA